MTTPQQQQRDSITENFEGNNLFYYESSTSTYNFGYGYNLTDNSNWAKVLENSGIPANTINLLQAAISHNITDLTTVNNSLSSVANIQSIKQILLDNYFSTNVDNTVTDNLPDDYTITNLPNGIRTALEDLTYNVGPKVTFWGSGLNSAIVSGLKTGDFSAAAYELAFATAPVDGSNLGYSKRTTADGIEALGLNVTLDSNHDVIGVSGTAPSNTAVAEFMEQGVKNPQFSYGTPQDYALGAMDNYTISQGFYVTATGDTYSSIALDVSGIKGVTPSTLADLNSGTASDNLPEGKLLLIPTASMPITGSSTILNAILNNNNGVLDLRNDYFYQITNLQNNSGTGVCTIDDPNGKGLESFAAGTIANVSATGNQVSINLNNGGQQDILTNPSSNIVTQIEDFTLLSAKLTITDVKDNLTNNTSLEQVYTGLPSGDTLQAFTWSGANATGNLTQELTNYTNNTSQFELFNPSNSVTSEFENYSGINGSGKDTSNLYNWTAGGSQLQQFSSLPATITEEITNYTGANDSGTLLTGINDYTTGKSTEEIFSGNPSGVTTEFNYYSGLNDTGNLTQQTINYTAGNSQVELFNPSSGISNEFYNFSATNGTGTDNKNIIDWTAGGSQEQIFTGLPSTITEEITNYTGVNDSGTLLTGINDYTTGKSTEEIFSGNPSGVTTEFNYYSGLNDTGNLTQQTINYNAGNSQVEAFNPTAGIASEFQHFSSINGTGTESNTVYNLNSGNDGTLNLSNATIDPASGTTATIDGSGLTINASTNDKLTLNGNNDNIIGGSGDSYTINGSYDPVSSSNSTVDYTGSTTGDNVTGSGDSYNDGGNNYGDGGDGGGDDGGDDGGGFDFTKSAKLGNISIGLVVQNSTQSSDSNASLAAQKALAQANVVAHSTMTGNYKAVLEGEKWNNVVTWSLAASSGTAASPFTSYMNNSYLALVQKAFDAWAGNSGLKLQEVTDSANSDIRIGWGSFNTLTSGILGYTAYQTNNGAFQPNEIVRLEDPSQDALTGSGINMTYSGSQATLYQVLLHEIGHAIGFADNADPHSVMYYESTNSNQTLDKTDIAGVKSLYGSQDSMTSNGSITGSRLASLVGSFAASDSIFNLITATQIPNVHTLQNGLANSWHH